MADPETAGGVVSAGWSASPLKTGTASPFSAVAGGPAATGGATVAGGPAATGGPAVQAPRQRSPRRGRSLEFPLLVVLAVIIAVLVNTYVAQVFYIPSASMVPQLRINDRVVVSKLSYRLHAPRRGDIVVFSAPPQEQGAHGNSSNPVGRALQAVGRALGVSESKTELIKRVIGLPGDTVQGRDGRVYIDGLPLTEPYLPDGAVTDDFGPVTVPARQLWVMGDNRLNSTDSRVFGPIPESSVVGRAIWRIWPLDHLSFL